VVKPNAPDGRALVVHGVFQDRAGTQPTLPCDFRDDALLKAGPLTPQPLLTTSDIIGGIGGPKRRPPTVDLDMADNEDRCQLKKVLLSIGKHPMAGAALGKIFGGVVNKRPEIFLAVGRPPRLPF